MGRLNYICYTLTINWIDFTHPQGINPEVENINHVDNLQSYGYATHPNGVATDNPLTTDSRNEVYLFTQYQRYCYFKT